MPRSGSTWLYNAARLLLRRAPQGGADLSGGWIGDWRRLPKRRRLLLKVHEFDPFLAKKARLVLYSYRDLRDALASCRRKFDIEPSLEATIQRALQRDRRHCLIGPAEPRIDEQPVQIALVQTRVGERELDRAHGETDRTVVEYPPLGGETQSNDHLLGTLSGHGARV